MTVVDTFISTFKSKVKQNFASPRSLVATTLVGVFFAVLPSAFRDDSDTTFNQLERIQVRNNLHRPFFKYTAFGALMCSIPLVFDTFLDMRISRSFTFSAAQVMLQLSIVAPCVVWLAQLLISEHVTICLFSMMSNVQELFFVGALLTFHTITNDRKNFGLKVFCFGLNCIHIVGSLLVAYHNLGIGSSFVNWLGLFLVFGGVVGIIGLGLYNLYLSINLVWNPKVLVGRTNTLYSLTLFANTIARLIIYFMASGSGNEKTATQESYFIIVNTTSILLLSIHHSRNIKSGYLVTKSRLEAKRNFVRFISHEIRTPLNTVSMGLQLVIREMKSKIMSLDGFGAQIKGIDTSAKALPAGASLGPRAPSMTLRSSCSNKVDDYGPTDAIYQSTVGGFLKLVEESNDSCEIAIDILNDILTYDKLDSNDLKLHTRKINVQELVLSNCKGFANQARNLGIRLNLLNRDADMDLSNVFVDVDSGKIGQVLRNLISNALKFTPVDGTIDVSVRFVREMSMNAPTFGSYDEAIVTGSGDVESGTEGMSAGTCFFHSSPPQSYVHAEHPPSKPHYVRIDVKDSGVGLSVEKQQQLFDGVVQFEDRESINRFGAGLGLYISKQIMDMHRSYLAVQSDGVPGKGSTFSIFLKICRVNDEELSDPDPGMDVSVTVRTGSYKSAPGVGGAGGGSLGTFMKKFFRRGSGMAISPAIPEVNSPSHSNSGSVQRHQSGLASAVAHGCPSASLRVNNSHLLNHSLNSELDISSEPPEKSLTPPFAAVGGEGTAAAAADVGIPLGFDSSDGPVEKIVYKLLIVDDSALNRKLLGRFLQSYFDEILYAEDGVVAMDLYADALANGVPVGLVLMDNVMPNMDGLQTAQAIRALDATVPIIGITGNGLPDQITEFVAHGATVVLQKPVNFDRLQQAILAVMQSGAPPALMNS